MLRAQVTSALLGQHRRPITAVAVRHSSITSGLRSSENLVARIALELLHTAQLSNAPVGRGQLKTAEHVSAR